jgi:hypothetical protein
MKNTLGTLTETLNSVTGKRIPNLHIDIGTLIDRLNGVASSVQKLTSAEPKRKTQCFKNPSAEPSNSNGEQVSTPSPIAGQSPVSAGGSDSPLPSPSSGKKPKQESPPTSPESIGTGPQPTPSGQQHDQVSAPVDDKPQARPEAQADSITQEGLGFNPSAKPFVPTPSSKLDQQSPAAPKINQQSPVSNDPLG